MKTILIIDDEKKIRNVYGKMLCREGYNILKAENAETAHELLMRNDVDLVLLDINMPDVKGSFFYKIIAEFFNETKVIVASVYPIEYQQIQIPEAADYHDKADSIKALIQKVNSACQTNPPETFDMRKQA